MRAESRTKKERERRGARRKPRPPVRLPRDSRRRADWIREGIVVAVMMGSDSEVFAAGS